MNKVYLFVFCVYCPISTANQIRSASMFGKSIALSPWLDLRVSVKDSSDLSELVVHSRGMHVSLTGQTVLCLLNNITIVT